MINPPTSHYPILLFNGPSSVGKTTLCKAVQAVLEWPTIHLEEDKFVYGTVHPRFLQAVVGEATFERTMLGYYRSLAAFASAGWGVLADTGLYSPALVETCARELAGCTVWMIGLRCGLAELERREQARADRPAGLAKSQIDSIHAHVHYDVEVDTSTQSPQACALEIKAAVEQLGEPTALRSLTSRSGR